MIKKRITVSMIILFVIIISLTFIINRINHNSEIKRYEEIKKNVKKAAIEYLTIMQRIDISTKKYLYEDDIVNPLKRGAEKDIILDIDKKSYCKVAIEGFVKDNKWNANVYLKCKKYEDDLYEKTLVMYMCANGVPKGYEHYYKKYGMEYDNFVCPIVENIKKEKKTEK